MEEWVGVAEGFEKSGGARVEQGPFDLARFLVGTGAARGQFAGPWRHQTFTPLSRSVAVSRRKGTGRQHQRTTGLLQTVV